MPQEKEPKSLHFNNKISVVILKAKFLEVQRAGEGEQGRRLELWLALPAPARPNLSQSQAQALSPHLCRVPGLYTQRWGWDALGISGRR